MALRQESQTNTSSQIDIELEARMYVVVLARKHGKLDELVPGLTANPPDKAFTYISNEFKKSLIDLLIDCDDVEILVNLRATIHRRPDVQSPYMQDILSRIKASIQKNDHIIDPVTGKRYKMFDLLFQLSSRPTDENHLRLEKFINQNKNSLLETFEIYDVGGDARSLGATNVTVNALGYAVRYNCPRVVAFLLSAGAELTKNMVACSLLNPPVFHYLLSAQRQKLIQVENLAKLIDKLMVLQGSALDKTETLGLLLTIAKAHKTELTSVIREQWLRTARAHYPIAIKQFIDYDQSFQFDLQAHPEWLTDSIAAAARLKNVDEQNELCAILVPLITNWNTIFLNPVITQFILQRFSGAKALLQRHINAVDKGSEPVLHTMVCQPENPELIDYLKLLFSLGLDPEAKDNTGKTALQVARDHHHYVLAYHVIQAILALRAQPKALVLAEIDKSLTVEINGKHLCQCFEKAYLDLAQDLCQLSSANLPSLTAFHAKSEWGRAITKVNETFSQLKMTLNQYQSEIRDLKSSLNEKNLLEKALEFDRIGMSHFDFAHLFKIDGFCAHLIMLHDEALKIAKKISTTPFKGSREQEISELKKDTGYSAKFVLAALYEIGHLQLEQDFASENRLLISPVALFKPATHKNRELDLKLSSSSNSSSSLSSSDLSSSSEEGDVTHKNWLVS